MEKNLTPEMLNQLKERVGNDKDHINGVNTHTDLENWNKLRQPYLWEIVEEKDDCKVVLDTAYGHIALFKNDILLDISSRSIVLEDVVVLDKEAYSSSKYIWM